MDLFNQFIKEAFVDRIPEKPLQPPHVYPSNDSFDPWDNALMHDICGKRQAKPIADLLILLSQLDMTDKSFGVSPNRFLEMAAPMLRELRAACVDDWKDQ
jgi:hypothetical protein